MGDNLLKKSLAVGIILIFVLPSLIPVVSANNPQINTDDYWGFILKAEIDSVIYTWNNDSFWSVTIEFNYFVMGIGRHDIFCEFEYEVHVLDENTSQPELYTGNVTFNDSIYLFQPTKQPMIKLKASGYQGLEPFSYYLEGNWTGRLYVDEELIDQIEIYWEWEP